MFRHDNQQDDQAFQGQPGQFGGGAPGDPVDHAAAAAASDSSMGYVATPAPGAPGNQTVNTDDLLDIKQQALQQLSPLVGHLEQTPEEKFRTTMMMIQASDNHALVREAYEAAKDIPNEKDRAQALLDIVNEINYFTQQGSSEHNPAPASGTFHEQQDQHHDQ